MNDLLFGNNNQAVIRKLADRSIKSDKRSRAFLLLTIALAVCMVFSIFLVSTGTQLVVCGALSILLGLVSAIFTIIAGVFVGYPGLTFSAAMYASIQITALNIFLYIAVLPIIILTSRMSNGALIGCIIAFVYGYGGMFASGNMTLANFYPITASLGLIGYRAYDAAVNWNVIHCLCSIAAVIIISAVLVMLSKNVEPKKTVKKSKKVKTKKGW